MKIVKKKYARFAIGHVLFSVNPDKWLFDMYQLNEARSELFNDA